MQTASECNVCVSCTTWSCGNSSCWYSTWKMYLCWIQVSLTNKRSVLYMDRCVEPDLKSLSVGIFTMALRVLGRLHLFVFTIKKDNITMKFFQNTKITNIYKCIVILSHSIPCYLLHMISFFCNVPNTYC